MVLVIPLVIISVTVTCQVSTEPDVGTPLTVVLLAPTAKIYPSALHETADP